MPRNIDRKNEEEPGYTVWGIPPDAWNNNQVPLTRAYSSQEAAKVAEKLLERAGARRTWIKFIGPPRGAP